MIHEDFVYWKKVATNLLSNEEEQLKELREKYYFHTVANTSTKMLAIMMLNYDNHYVNAVPSNIINRYTGLTLFSHIIFERDIYFVVDEKYNTCHYASNSTGVNYFTADKDTREMIIMEKRLFNV